MILDIITCLAKAAEAPHSGAAEYRDEACKSEWNGGEQWYYFSMKTAYQYRLDLDPQQKVTMHHWLRTCQYWYNRMLGERFDWWEQNRCAVNACPLVTFAYRQPVIYRTS